jgi:hypothetical protein
VTHPSRVARTSTDISVALEGRKFGLAVASAPFTVAHRTTKGTTNTIRRSMDIGARKTRERSPLAVVQPKSPLIYGLDYLMCTPEMARAMMRRCISLVPSKIV